MTSNKTTPATFAVSGFVTPYAAFVALARELTHISLALTFALLALAFIAVPLLSGTRHWLA